MTRSCGWWATLLSIAVWHSSSTSSTCSQAKSAGCLRNLPSPTSVWADWVDDWREIYEYEGSVIEGECNSSIYGTVFHFSPTRRFKSHSIIPQCLIIRVWQTRKHYRFAVAMYLRCYGWVFASGTVFTNTAVFASAAVFTSADVYSQARLSSLIQRCLH